MAHKSEVGRWECTAEHAREWHVTGEADEDRFKGEGFGIVAGLYLPSQSMQENGEQGSQTTSLPVSM